MLVYISANMNMQLMSCPSHKQQHCQLINAITSNQCNTGPFVRTTHINMHHLNSVKTLEWYHSYARLK